MLRLHTCVFKIRTEESFIVELISLSIKYINQVKRCCFREQSTKSFAQAYEMYSREKRIFHSYTGINIMFLIFQLLRRLRSFRWQRLYAY